MNRIDPTMEPLTFEQRGFPYTTFPTGWFQVAWSDELAPGAVVPMRFFATDLVLFRTESGEAVVLDGTCPHFGALLAHAGEVRGDCLQCPFHGWVWQRDGALVDVPYSHLAGC